jgi:hypothetical protein
MLMPLVLVVLSPQPAPGGEQASPVPFPHPLITEVLYNVPPGAEGDADGDGVRSPTGDEFVELINPHDKPIRLKGYILTDGKNTRRPAAQPPKEDTNPPRQPGRKPDSPGRSEPPPAQTLPEDDSRIRFVFPDITLEPGQVVVVFNGYKGEMPAEPSDKAPGPTPPREPASPAENRPAGATPQPIRLSMNITSQYCAFANNGDCVLLSDPDGRPVQCITWGQQPKPPDGFAPLIERAPETRTRGSVARVGLTRTLVDHRSLPGDLKGLPFSPGVHPIPAPTK